MTERTPPAKKWLRRLVKDGPGDGAELIELLRDVARRGVIGADALAMIEGVLGVADLQVRDIMVPRSQMVVLERDSAPGRLVFNRTIGLRDSWARLAPAQAVFGSTLAETFQRR